MSGLSIELLSGFCGLYHACFGPLNSKIRCCYGESVCLVDVWVYILGVCVRARARARCDGLETVVVSRTQKGFPVTQISSSTSVLVLLLYCKNTLISYVQAMY